MTMRLEADPNAAVAQQLDPLAERPRTLWRDAWGSIRRSNLALAAMIVVGLYVLIALRFLMDRFPSMTRFRYSAGAGREAGSEKVPVLASFHHDQQRGYFVALSLDIHGISLNA